MVETSQEHQVKSPTTQFIVKQIEEILNLFNPDTSPSCLFEQNGKLHYMSFFSQQQNFLLDNRFRSH